MNINTLIITIALVLGFSGQSHACRGGENSMVPLNDIKMLVANGLRDTEKNMTYTYADDVEQNGEGYSYDVSDSAGNITHNISVSTNQAGFAVSVKDLASGETKIYQGQRGLLRGCNEIKEIQ